MELATELSTDFKRGQLDDTAGTRFPTDALALCLNGRLEADASVRRRGGSKRLHSTALNSGGVGYCATPFIKADGTIQFIVVSGDKAYKSEDYGASFTQIATGLRTDYYDVATMRVGATNYLFLANGDTTIKQWDGTTWSTVSGAPSGVKYLDVFNNRLWVTGHSGVLVQACEIGDPTNWSSPDALTVQLNIATGDTPTGLRQVGPHLLVFTSDQTAYIDGFGETTLIVASGATGISGSVGCVAFRSIVRIGDSGCAWFSKRGIEFYQPGQGITLLSRNVTDYMEQVDREDIYTTPGMPCGAYDPIREEYRLALSTTGARNDIIFRVSLRQRATRPGRPLDGAITIDQPISLTGDILILGGADNYVTTGAGGYQLTDDAGGYVTLATDGLNATPVSSDASGYLTSVVDDTMPATIFVAPTASHPALLHTVGYDGFVRRFGTGDKDDVLSDGTGGSSITMTLVSRPFYFGNPRAEKKVRVAHVASIQDAQVTITVAIRAKGVTTGQQSVTIASTALDQAKRIKKMVSAIADAPQLEVTTTDDARITLMGLSASLRRERV